MALAACRRASRSWWGLQALAVAAERLQLQLSPSICAGLQQALPAAAAAPGEGWRASPPWWQAAPCASSRSELAGIRWHSSKAGAAAEKEAASGSGGSSHGGSSSSSGGGVTEVSRLPLRARV